MAGGYWVRRDVLAACRYTLYNMGAGTHTLEAFLRAYRTVGTQVAPSAQDATEAEIRDALRALQVLRGEHEDKIWKAW